MEAPAKEKFLVEEATSISIADSSQEIILESVKKIGRNILVKEMSMTAYSSERWTKLNRQG